MWRFARGIAFIAEARREGKDTLRPGCPWCPESKLDVKGAPGSEPDLDRAGMSVDGEG